MSENVQYSIDDVCNFFNQIESNYERLPLQSTFIANQILPLKHHEANMEEQIINICAKTKSKYKLPKAIINKYKAKFENCPKDFLKKNISSNFVDLTFQTNSDNIDKGLELADDLMKSYDTYMRNIPPVPKQVEATSNNMPSRNNSDNNHINNHNNANRNNININNDNHNDSIIAQQEAPKQMKFKTAKEQYIAEVLSIYYTH